MKILGIDPGLSGALVLLSRGDDGALSIESSWLMPTIKSGKGTRRDLNLPALVDGIRVHKSDLIVIERQHAFPGRKGEGDDDTKFQSQGVVSTGKTMYGFGALCGIVTALKIPLEIVAPKTWQKACGLLPGADKAAHIARARELFPTLDLTPGAKRKPQDGIADAALIALFGARK